MTHTPPVAPGRRTPWFGWLLLVGLIPTLVPAPQAADTAFRVGFSRRLFSDVNENDARASMKAWGQTVARERGIPVAPEPLLLDSAEACSRALRSQEADAVALPLPDFRALDPRTPLGPFFVTVANQASTERYVVVVRADAGIADLAKLRGKTLNLQEHPRTSLAPQWLDLLLDEAGMGAPPAFFGAISRVSKTSKAVLPVFFKQRDAALVTRAGYQVMVELNPQLGTQLRVLATSQEVVPVLLCFRGDYAPAFKDLVMTALRELHRTPSGQQVLNIFQGDRLEERPAAFFESSLTLLARHDRLLGGSAPPTPSSPTGRQTP